MPELDGRLWFDVLPDDSRILVRLYVLAPFAQKPAILEKLLELLARSNDVMSLAREFPEDERILLKLQAILDGSTIRPERVSGIHYGSDYGSEHGHSVHVQI